MSLEFYSIQLADDFDYWIQCIEALKHSLIDCCLCNCIKFIISIANWMGWPCVNRVLIIWSNLVLINYTGTMSNSGKSRTKQLCFCIYEILIIHLDFIEDLQKLNRLGKVELPEE